MTYSVDDARAARIEAAGGPFEFVHQGKTWTLPREFSIDAAEAVDALPGMDSIPGLRALLSALLGEQAEGFNVGSLSGQDLEGLIDAYFDHAGIRLGESSPSPSSSASTARRSKPTSKRSTASTSRASGKARSAGGASKS